MINENLGSTHFIIIMILKLQNALSKFRALYTLGVVVLRTISLIMNSSKQCDKYISHCLNFFSSWTSKPWVIMHFTRKNIDVLHECFKRKFYGYEPGKKLFCWNSTGIICWDLLNCRFKVLQKFANNEWENSFRSLDFYKAIKNEVVVVRMFTSLKKP